MLNVQPEIETMASGNLSLTITEDVSWKSFPSQAQAFLEMVKGRRLKIIDTPVERMWFVLIRWRFFFLVYEDLPNRMTLDSIHPSCNELIPELCKTLIEAKNTQSGNR